MEVSRTCCDPSASTGLPPDRQIVPAAAGSSARRRATGAGRGPPVEGNGNFRFNVVSGSSSFWDSLKPCAKTIWPVARRTNARHQRARLLPVRRRGPRHHRRRFGARKHRLQTLRHPDQPCRSCSATPNPTGVRPQVSEVDSSRGLLINRPAPARSTPESNEGQQTRPSPT